MKGLLKGLALLAGLPAIALAIFYVWGSSGTTNQQTYSSIVDYGAAKAPEPNAVPKDSFTLVSYNLGYLSGLANNTAFKPNKAFFEANQARAVAALKAVSPDIVGFQEIDFEAKRSYDVDQAEAIAQDLGLGAGAIAINWDKNYLPFPYWPISAHFGKILSGQAILSRYPIEKNSRFVLERVANKPFFYNAFYLDRLAQVAEIRLGEQSVVVISVHLEAFEEQTRVNQTQFVRQLAEQYAQAHPVIVMGDFNSALNRPTFVTPQGVTLTEVEFSIKEMLGSDPFVPAVPPEKWQRDNATFPADNPAYKLDYVFYTSNTLEVLETQVIDAAGEASDHLPLMVRFRFKSLAVSE